MRKYSKVIWISIYFQFEIEFPANSYVLLWLLWGRYDCIGGLLRLFPASQRYPSKKNINIIWWKFKNCLTFGMIIWPGIKKSIWLKTVISRKIFSQWWFQTFGTIVIDPMSKFSAAGNFSGYVIVFGGFPRSMRLPPPLFSTNLY